MKRALVTGGTRGIGLAVCRALCEEGYCVTALYSRSEADANAAKAALPQVNFLRADVADENAVRAVFEALPSLSVLVNNAGIDLYRQVQDTTREEWRRVMDVNAGGAFFTAKYAVGKMKDEGGAIVNISSVWGQTGGSCESVYSASKGAMVAFTKALAKELAPCNITANCVAPGVIDTEMNARLSEEEKRVLTQEIPLARFGRAEEVASAVMFFVRNRYVTGETLSVNGGVYI